MATKTRKPVARRCRISTAVNGCFAMLLEVGKSRTGYYVEPFPSDFGRCFKLTKFSTDAGTDKDASTYEVCLDGPASDCSCKGYLRHGKCKHVSGLLALADAGKLGPMPAGRQPAPALQPLDDL